MARIGPGPDGRSELEDREVLQQKSQPTTLQVWGLRTPKYVLRNAGVKCRKSRTQLGRIILDHRSN